MSIEKKRRGKNDFLFNFIIIDGNYHQHWTLSFGTHRFKLRSNNEFGGHSERSFVEQSVKNRHIVSAITAVGSQQLADDVDGAGSPTNEKEKKNRMI